MTFQQAIEKIHQEKGKELEEFSGDAETFSSIRPHLESCLQLQYEDRKQKISPSLWIALGAIVLLLFGWGYLTFRENQRWASYLNRLNAAPGIVVTRATKSGSRFVVSGLRDPLSADPDIALQQSGLPPAKVSTHWEPYQALLPQFILERARHALQPPDTAMLKFENGVLFASGSAPHAWIQESAKLVRVMDGIAKFDATGLKDSDLQSIGSMKDRIEKTVIRFVRGKADFADGQDAVIEGFLAQISSLNASARRSEVRTILKIIGHADSEGTEELNFGLSRMRSERIVRLLWERGVDTGGVKTTGVGASQPVRSESSEQDKEWNRSVSFQVQILDSDRGEVR